MNIEDIELLEKYYCLCAKDDFNFYRKFINNFKIKTNWFTKKLNQELQAFYKAFISYENPTLIINTPPQHGKTSAIIEAISWYAGKCRDIQFIYASYSEMLGVRANLKLQRIMDSFKYKKIFPKTIIDSKLVDADSTYLRNKEKIEFINSYGSFRNTTVRGSITGESLDIGILDDVVKGREEANSSLVRDKTYSWFLDDFYSRFANKSGLIIIMTRWHIDDIVARLLKEGKKNIKTLIFKAIADEDEEFRKEGEPLFPELKSLEFLLERKKTMVESSWQSLYQQNPINPGGMLFKEDWFKFYEQLPILKHRTIYVDTAQKTKEKHDYTVFELWGESQNGQLYLIDLLRGKWESPELINRALFFWQKHSSINDNSLGILKAMKIEDKISGTTLIQTLQRKGGIPVIPIPRHVDKELRAGGVAPFVQSGNVFLPQKAEFMNDFINEVLTFPNGVHDDQVDPFIDAINDKLTNNNFSIKDLL